MILKKLKPKRTTSKHLKESGTVRQKANLKVPVKNRKRGKISKWLKRKKLKIPLNPFFLFLVEMHVDNLISAILVLFLKSQTYFEFLCKKNLNRLNLKQWLWTLSLHSSSIYYNIYDAFIQDLEVIPKSVLVKPITNYNRSHHCLI